jgi:hypothetical protein
MAKEKKSVPKKSKPRLKARVVLRKPVAKKKTARKTVKKKAQPKMKPARAPPKKTVLVKKPANAEFVPAAPVAATAPKTAPLTLPPIQPVMPQEHEVPKIRAPPGTLAPALELLPEWVDRSHLNGVVEDDGLVFTAPAAGSEDYKEAQRMLSNCRAANASLPGYLLICAKDRSGRISGALDGYVKDGILVILRSFTSSEKRRDMHVLLHSCALGMAKPAYVLCCTERPSFADTESAGKLVFIGRGIAMSALPFTHQTMLFFMRRIGKEYDPLSSGAELAKVALVMKPLCPEIEAAASVMSSKGVVPLILLPSSPDRLERLHELKDAAILLGLPADGLERIFDTLKERYVQSRIDITPAAI